MDLWGTGKKRVGARKIYNDGSFELQWSVGVDSSRVDTSKRFVHWPRGGGPDLRTGSVSVFCERSTKNQDSEFVYLNVV